MVRALLVAAAGAVTLVAGVVSTTPAFARGKPVDRNVPCEAPPPAADTVASRQGSVGLQLPGFGISGDRVRVTSRSDVVIAAEGSPGWFDMTMYLQACRAITLTWPNNPTKQMEELFKVRERLRSTATDVTAPSGASKISDTEAEGIIAAALGKKGSSERQSYSATTPSAAAPQQPRQPGQTAPSRARHGAPVYTSGAPAVTNAASAAGASDGEVSTTAKPPRVPATPLRAPPPSCVGSACSYPVEDNVMRGGDRTDIAMREEQEGRSYATSGRASCSQLFSGSGMMGGDCGGVTIRTCTTSAPVTLPGVGIRVGNMILPGMPVTISSGETTCSTTTSF